MKLWEMREAMQRWVNATELLDQNLEVVKGTRGSGFRDAEAPGFYPITTEGVEAEYTNDIERIVLI